MFIVRSSRRAYVIIPQILFGERLHHPFFLGTAPLARYYLTCGLPSPSSLIGLPGSGFYGRMPFLPP